MPNRANDESKPIASHAVDAQRAKRAKSRQATSRHAMIETFILILSTIDSAPNLDHDATTVSNWAMNASTHHHHNNKERKTSSASARHNEAQRALN